MDGRGLRGTKTAGALLASARRLWSERGFAGASVREIAQDAGVNSALVRYHFRSKEGLYERVIDGGMGELRERLLGAFGGEGEVVERLGRVVDAYLRYLVEEQEMTRLIQRALLEGDGKALSWVLEHLRPLWSVFAASLESLETPWGRVEDVVMSVFGAFVAPTLYGPLFSGLWEEDVLSPEACVRRREHISKVLGMALGGLSIRLSEEEQE